MNNQLLSAYLVTSGVLVLTSLLPATADVKMPAIFGDHMVLQQDLKLPVWGSASPGEKVTVTLGTETGTAVAGPDGNWRVDLAPVPLVSGSAPQTLTVAGTNTITFQDVLIGDVWVASGQSNMEFGVGALEHPGDEIAKANEPLLRLFCVPKVSAMTPQKEMGDLNPKDMLGKWEVCSPSTIPSVGTQGGFTAVGYYFGRALQHAVGHPVGMIFSAWGGTPAQAWTPITGLRKNPKLKAYVDNYDANAAKYPQASAAYPKALADYQAAKKQWDQEVGVDYTAKMTAWGNANAEALKNGQKPLPQPQPSRPPPQEPTDPDGGTQASSVLFNGMIAPLIPYGIKGAIWYQGESNANTIDSGEDYGNLFPQMIKEWREQWGEGDFPFIYVQLACYGTPATTPSQDSWPYLREAQSHTLALPATGMAVIVDIGDPANIHPKDKLDVGERLALAAEHVGYGKDLVYSGPTYDSMQIDGDKIIVSFKNVGGGLKISGPPWMPNGAAIPTPTELTGFGIAGADRKWVWAKATIDGDKVILSSDQVPAPVAVRYGWANTPPVDLYNKEGLPASPFRTDNWD